MADFKCPLTRQEKERYTTLDGRKWLINDAVLEEVDNDLQMIINCTQEGDVVSFDVMDVIKPSSLVTIPWQLTIDTHVEDHSGSDSSPRPMAKTRFTCPRKNSGLFLVQ